MRPLYHKTKRHIKLPAVQYQPADLESQVAKAGLERAFDILFDEVAADDQTNNLTTGDNLE